jgi:hypothetical protein
MSREPERVTLARPGEKALELRVNRTFRSELEARVSLLEGPATPPKNLAIFCHRLERLRREAGGLNAGEAKEIIAANGEGVFERGERANGTGET